MVKPHQGCHFRKVSTWCECRQDVVSHEQCRCRRQGHRAVHSVAQHRIQLRKYKPSDASQSCFDTHRYGRDAPYTRRTDCRTYQRRLLSQVSKKYVNATGASTTGHVQCRVLGRECWRCGSCGDNLDVCWPSWCQGRERETIERRTLFITRDSHLSSQPRPFQDGMHARIIDCLLDEDSSELLTGDASLCSSGNDCICFPNI